MHLQLAILTRFPFPGFHRLKYVEICWNIYRAMADFWATLLGQKNVFYSVLATSFGNYDFRFVVVSDDVADDTVLARSGDGVGSTSLSRAE